MKKCILYVLLVTGTSLLGSLDYITLAPIVEKYDWIKQPRSFITFVQDPYGNKYVVKQYRYEKWQSIPATSICELVALDMGHAIGVPLNKACLIPAGVAFIGKKTEAPASLHTLVPGIPFSEYLELYTGLYTDLDLKQKDEQSDPLGLSRQLIYHMSRHKDLAAMVALDTYVSNMGRLRHNFFYDEQTDMFYGIDMASSFFRDLCGPSMRNVNRMILDKKTHFTQAEGLGLINYYKALKKLIELYPSSVVCSMLDDYAWQAGYYNDSFFNKVVQTSCLELLNKRKRTIKISCKNAHKLLSALESLLKKHALMS